MSGLSATPSTTTFTIDDIPFTIFLTDGDSNILDLNVFGADNGEFTANGFLSFSFSIFPAGDFAFTNIQVQDSEAIPEPATILGSLVAVGLGTALKRKSSAS